MPKQTHITIPYSAARLNALRLAVPALDEDIQEYISKIYDKKVGSDVKQFVALLESQESTAAGSRPKNRAKEAPEGV